MIRLTRRRDDGDKDDPLLLVAPDEIVSLCRINEATQVEMRSGNVHEVTETVEVVERLRVAREDVANPLVDFLDGLPTSEGSYYIAWLSSGLSTLIVTRALSMMSSGGLYHVDLRGIEIPDRPKYWHKPHAEAADTRDPKYRP